MTHTINTLYERTNFPKTRSSNLESNSHKKLCVWKQKFFKTVHVGTHIFSLTLRVHYVQWDGGGESGAGWTIDLTQCQSNLNSKMILIFLVSDSNRIVYW